MTNFSEFLIRSTRISGQRREITVIDPQNFEGFIKKLSESELSDEKKVLIGILVTGGLRVSEGLSLKKSDFMEEEGNLFFRSKVLKKSSKMRRMVLVHPALQNLVRDRISKIRQYDRVLNLSRKTVYNIFRRIFGKSACPHSIARHSYISWLVHEKKITSLEAARIMEIKVSTVESYNHPNVKKSLQRLFAA